jgi:hypothetical protein
MSSTTATEPGFDAVDTRKVGAFLALAFGISWTGAGALYVAGVELQTITENQGESPRL